MCSHYHFFVIVCVRSWSEQCVFELFVGSDECMLTGCVGISFVSAKDRMAIYTNSLIIQSLLSVNGALQTYPRRTVWE